MPLWWWQPSQQLKDTDYEKAKTTYENAQRAYAGASRKANIITTRNDKIVSELNRQHNKTYGDQAGNNENWSKFFDKSKAYVEEKNKAVNDANAAAFNVATAKYNYTNAKSVYEKSAGHKVADFLNKASDKVDQAKNWIKNLFKKKK
jgi:hypothetical protein